MHGCGDQIASAPHETSRCLEKTCLDIMDMLRLLALPKTGGDL